MFRKKRLKPGSKKLGCLGIIGVLFLCGLPAVFTQERGDAAPKTLVDAQPTAAIVLPTDTPVIALVSELVQLPTDTPTAPPAPLVPTDTPVVLPTDTAIPQPVGATVNNGANLRAGPSTDYAVVSTAAAGALLRLIGRNQAGDWYQTDSGVWISASLVDNAPTDLAIVAAPALPAPTVAVVAAPVQQVTQAPITTIPSATCDCTADTLNCSDFTGPSEAQACFDHCMATVGRDIHGLDRGGQVGVVCESSW